MFPSGSGHASARAASQTYDEVVRRSGQVLGVASLLAVSAAALGACSGGADPGIRVRAVGRATVTEVVEAPATVAAKATADVTAAASGRVAELRVREGQQVRAGAVLLRISSPDAARQLRDARSADARAASAGTVTIPGTGGLTAAQRRAERAANAAFARARTTAAAIADPTLRAQSLAAVDASRAQYTAATAQAQDAVRRFNAGLGTLATAVSSLSSAQRVQTRAAVSLAERTVDALTVRSAISGTVSLAGRAGSAGSSGGDLLSQLPDSLRGQAGGLLGGAGGGSGGAASGTVTGTLEEGQPVVGGQSLLTVTDASALSLTAQVDETDVLLVRRGVRATAEFDAVPGASYAATVATIDPAPSTSTRGGVTFVVRLALGPGRTADGTVAPEPRPGMSAVVNLDVRTAKDAVAVPAPAVFRDGKLDVVWVVTSGTARRRVVRVGAQGADAVQVLEGLQTGERIVVRGADKVRAGQSVP